MQVNNLITLLAFPLMFYWRVVRPQRYRAFAKKAVQFIILVIPGQVMMFAIEKETQAQRDVAFAIFISSALCCVQMLTVMDGYSTFRHLIKQLAAGYLVMGLASAGLLYTVADDGVTAEHLYYLAKSPFLVATYMARLPWNARAVARKLKDSVEMLWIYMTTDEETIALIREQMDMTSDVGSAPSIGV